jgi:hypothetical protein
MEQESKIGDEGEHKHFLVRLKICTKQKTHKNIPKCIFHILLDFEKCKYLGHFFP